MFIERYEEIESIEDEGMFFVLHFLLFLSFAVPLKFYSAKFHSLGNLSAQCHYCTHYSSAIIVCSFLVRMEPFSHTFQALQVSETHSWSLINPSQCTSTNPQALVQTQGSTGPLKFITFVLLSDTNLLHGLFSALQIILVQLWSQSRSLGDFNIYANN